MVSRNTPQQPSIKKGVPFFCQLFFIYLKSMALAFTGGLAAIPILESELVTKSKLVSKEDFLEITALSQSLPGIIGLNHAIIIGHKLYGKIGSIACALGTIFPAYFSMLIVAVIFQDLPNNPIVLGMVQGIRAVSIAVILGAGLRIVKQFKKNRFSILLVLFSLCVPLFTSISTFYTILLSGTIGILYTAFHHDEKVDNSTQKEQDPCK